MKIFIKGMVIFFGVCELNACTPRMTQNLWNGVYSELAGMKEYERKRDEFYAEETMEQKDLREKNQIVCERMAQEKYPNNTIWEDQNGFKWAMLYESCMKERGSPVYK